MKSPDGWARQSTGQSLHGHPSAGEPQDLVQVHPVNPSFAMQPGPLVMNARQILGFSSGRCP